MFVQQTASAVTTFFLTTTAASQLIACADADAVLCVVAACSCCRQLSGCLAADSRLIASTVTFFPCLPRSVAAHSRPRSSADWLLAPHACAVVFRCSTSSCILSVHVLAGGRPCSTSWMVGGLELD